MINIYKTDSEMLIEDDRKGKGSSSLSDRVCRSDMDFIWLALVHFRWLMKRIFKHNYGRGVYMPVEYCTGTIGLQQGQDLLVTLLAT